MFPEAYLFNGEILWSLQEEIIIVKNIFELEIIVISVKSYYH